MVTRQHRSCKKRSAAFCSLLLVLQRQVAFIALVNMDAVYIVQGIFVLYDVRRCYVGTVIDAEQNFLCRLRRDSIDFIPGKLPEIRPYRRNGNGMPYSVAVLIGNILRFLYFYFFVFQLYSGFSVTIQSPSCF